LAFSGDGRLLAITRTLHRVQLVDPTSGRELATLVAPDEHLIHGLCFNHDGTQLAATTGDHGVQLWDLRLLRQQLAAMELDWDRRRYPLPDAEISKPILVEVEQGDAAWPKPMDLSPAGQRQAVGLTSFVLALNPFNFYAYERRGNAHAALGEIHQAVADYTLALACMPKGHPRRALVLDMRASMFLHHGEFAKAQSDWEQALELVPEQADTCNSLAWLYLTSPDKLRNSPRALALAKKAVELTPGEWQYLNTLGVAYYRQGQYEHAIQSLQRSLHDSKGEAAAYDLFFLAMCHAHLGDVTHGKECYEQALRWMGARQGKLPMAWIVELAAFQAEADAVLAKRVSP
jgi:tetratricopeptide (TPR) repeat protein